MFRSAMEVLELDSDFQFFFSFASLSLSFPYSEQSTINASQREHNKVEVY
jgi:hypothetical protein